MQRIQRSTSISITSYSEVKARRRKPVLNEEKKIDFFPQLKPQQGVIGEKEEEEREEEEVPIIDFTDVEAEGLIRVYQRKAKPT